MHTYFTKETVKGQSSVSRFFLVMMVAWILSMTGHATCSAQSVALSWDPNTESTLAGYKVYYKADVSTTPFYGTGAVEGASPIDVHNQTTATVSGLDPSKTYYFAITAYNTSGLESAYSSIVTISESLAPTIAVSAPANNSTASGTVSVTASASDNIGVTKLEFYVNGVLKSSDTSPPYVYSWNTSSLTSGTYTLMAKAYDAAGNVGQSSNVAVTVVNDTTAPTVSLTAPSNNATVSGTVAITASAGDNVGVSKVEFYENGVLLSATNIPPYSYNWSTTSVTNGSCTLTAKAYDNAGNIGQSSSVAVTVNNVVPDTTAPVVSAFTMPATATILTVPVSSFIATDAVGVSGYLITENPSTPSASATGWTSSAPTSFTFSAAGSKTAYAWAKDAAGNVSSSRSDAVTISLSDTTAPTVSAFTIPTAATSLTVAVSSFTATDAVGVTGYLITESSSTPSASATGWTSSAPTSFTFSASGSKTAYAWAKDAAGNVSSSRSDAVTISLSDTTAPVVSAFSLPSTSTSLSVAVSSLTATDTVGVTGYLITESATAPSASASGWSVSAPTSFTFSASGSKTAYAWAKDAAGNVSSNRSDTVTITLPDTTAPTVSAFTIPTAATSLTVAVSSFTATDAVGVTGYLITESSSTPSASATGWTSSAPTSFTFSAAGSKTAYAWAKDAAGNVSSNRSDTVTITLTDTSAPVVSTFTMPATATSLSVPVTSLTATDSVKLAGYLITETSSTPSAGAAGWTTSVPTTFTFSAAGLKEAYAWAKDAAGNVSASRSTVVTITQPVATAALTINDALTALQIAVGKVQPTSDQMIRLDVAPYINGKSQPDGKIDIGDVIVVLGNVSGKIAL